MQSCTSSEHETKEMGIGISTSRYIGYPNNYNNNINIYEYKYLSSIQKNKSIALLLALSYAFRLPALGTFACIHT